MDKRPAQVVRQAPERSVDIEPLYDAREIALRCKVSEKSLHRWARAGKIPAVKFGKLWRFRKSAIDTWLNSKMAG